MPPAAKSILFVDDANTRLSFMAEAIARVRIGDRGVVLSAGYDARDRRRSERAVECLAGFGIVPDERAPRRLAEVTLADFDVVVALSRGAESKLRPLVGARLVVWSVPDPWQGTFDAYESACISLFDRLEELLRQEPKISDSSVA